MIGDFGGAIFPGIPSHLAYVVQLAVAIVFLLSALPKLRQPQTFASAVAGYHLLDRRLSRPVAYSLIPVELFLAVALSSGWFLAVALPLATVSLAAFAAAVAINLQRNRQVRCGCFGNPDELISRRSLLRLSALLGGCTLLLGLALTGTPLVTFAQLLSGGTASLAYVVESATSALFLIVVGVWTLNLSELGSAMGLHAGTPAATRPEKTTAEVR